LQVVCSYFAYNRLLIVVDGTEPEEMIEGFLIYNFRIDLNLK